MKRLILHIILFLAPVFTMILLLPINKRYKYQYLEHDCFNHALWIYDRMHINPAPVDIAFIGSSHTVNGINDRLIEELLGDSSVHVANFGYCRLGRNLSYVMIKELLATKKPKLIILEVRGDEDWFSHPIFPYIADQRDVYLPWLLYNRKLPNDLYTATGYKIEILKDKWYGKIKDAPIRMGLYGWSASIDTASRAYLTQVKNSRKPSHNMSAIERAVQMMFPRAYLRKIDRLCRTHHCKLTFLYLPQYRPVSDTVKELNTYKKYGNIIFPPDSLLNNPDLRHDGEHLNQAGADKLAVWLAQKLKAGINASETFSDQ